MALGGGCKGGRGLLVLPILRSFHMLATSSSLANWSARRALRRAARSSIDSVSICASWASLSLPRTRPLLGPRRESPPSSLVKNQALLSPASAAALCSSPTLRCLELPVMLFASRTLRVISSSSAREAAGPLSLHSLDLASHRSVTRPTLEAAMNWSHSFRIAPSSSMGCPCDLPATLATRSLGSTSLSLMPGSSRWTASKARAARKRCFCSLRLRALACLCFSASASAARLRALSSISWGPSTTRSTSTAPARRCRGFREHTIAKAGLC
mmetsp:Transcript_21787/g.60378  ORF Transcript_21787/g.60378 Transcript_21787/m.60378 type:complete len:270 (-) Transcript_21787:758-1567(-)